MDTIHYCSVCRKQAMPDKDKSTETWDYYSSDCAYCGGKKTVKICFLDKGQFEPSPREKERVHTVDIIAKGE